MARGMLVAGNWKMNGVASSLTELSAIAKAAGDYPAVDVALCLPATLIDRAHHLVPDFQIGGQDVHSAANGAHTGDVSAAMLVDAGARLVIVGHSERRQDHRERDSDVNAKATSGIAAGLKVILCIGESDAVRSAGLAVETVCAQLDASLPGKADASQLSIAYEPVWAIGTGKVPSVAEIEEMHVALRQRLTAAYGGEGDNMRILYGGSVKASNAAELFAVPNVDGALVGGASLQAADFLPIVAAASAARP
ncbi:MAG: triose-phosphate isomerase [Sphingomicrobium sp.]